MGLCLSPLFQLGGLSHILMSEDSGGIRRSLQESVGKQALCNHKPSKFSCSSKWKMLMILPLRRSDESRGSALLPSALQRVPPRGAGATCSLLLAPWQGWCPGGDTCQPCPCPRGCTVSSTIAGDTASLPLPRRAGEGREATAAELRSSPRVDE